MKNPNLNLEEMISMVEKLCKKGQAYRRKRMAAGEKSSAYLSGRAVKVCKGQMKGEGIDETDMSIQEVLDMEVIDENVTEAKYKGKKTQRCLPRAKAQSLTKKQRAATSRKKTRSKKQFVKNTKAAKVRLKK